MCHAREICQNKSLLRGPYGPPAWVSTGRQVPPVLWEAPGAPVWVSTGRRVPPVRWEATGPLVWVSTGRHAPPVTWEATGSPSRLGATPQLVCEANSPSVTEDTGPEEGGPFTVLICFPGEVPRLKLPGGEPIPLHSAGKVYSINSSSGDSRGTTTCAAREAGGSPHHTTPAALRAHPFQDVSPHTHPLGSVSPGWLPDARHLPAPSPLPLFLQVESLK